MDVFELIHIARRDFITNNYHKPNALYVKDHDFYIELIKAVIKFTRCEIPDGGFRVYEMDVYRFDGVPDDWLFMLGHVSKGDVFPCIHGGYDFGKERWNRMRNQSQESL